MAHGVGAALQLCRAFVAQAPIDGAAFTVMTSASRWDTLCASDDVIAAVEELQFSLGEGPVADAFRTRRPVLVSDMSSSGPASRWPVFAAGTADLQVGGLFAFPMQLGAITVGVCATYRRLAGGLGTVEVQALLRAVDIVTLSLLAARAGDEQEYPDLAWLDGHDRRRRLVHQATGMLTVQLGLGAEEAFARMRAYAFAEGRSVDAVAEDVVARRLRLDPDRT